MRSVVTFLIGSVIGATAILLYLETSGQLVKASPAPVRPSAAFPATTADGELVMPVQGIKASSLRSNFNDARGMFRTHHALDILAPRGTPVVAAVDGTVRKLFVSNGGGITIYEFDRNAEKVYYYAHLERYADGLHEGMTVKRGDVIGYVGTTGNAPANTPHLHFAVAVITPEKLWWKSTPVDPYPMLVQSEAERAVDAAAGSR